MYPGNWLWLLNHELRLAWRNVGGKRLWVLLIGGGFIWAAVHLAAWGVLHKGKVITGTELSSLTFLTAGAIFWMFFSLMVSQATAHAVSALFDRGDLDLVLASPLSPRVILAVRGLGIALAACLLPFLLLLPFAHAGLVTGKPGLLAIYPVIAALGLTSAATGLLIIMTLVQLFGVRRAKILTQIVAALIGAAFFLLFQARNFLSHERQNAFIAWVQLEIQPGGWFATDSILWWPVRAMLGEVLPLSVIVIGAAGSFWLVANLLFKRFVSGTQETISGGHTKLRNGTLAQSPNFRSGMILNLLVKEWKLLVRDPQIISQTLLQIFYLIPLILIGFKGEHSIWLLVPGFIMITSMLAGNLAWLTIAAEDAPELIGIAPIAIERVRWIKGAAAIMPVLALLLPLVLYWLTRDVYGAFVLLFCGTGGALSAALCQIWNPRQGDRRDMKKRYRENRIVNIFEALGSLGWVGMAICMSGHWLWLPLALTLVVLGLGTAWILGFDARARGALV